MAIPSRLSIFVVLLSLMIALVSVLQYQSAASAGAADSSFEFYESGFGNPSVVGDGPPHTENTLKCAIITATGDDEQTVAVCQGYPIGEARLIFPKVNFPPELREIIEAGSVRISGEVLKQPGGSGTMTIMLTINQPEIPPPVTIIFEK